MIEVKLLKGLVGAIGFLSPASYMCRLQIQTTLSNSGEALCLWK